MKPVTLDEYKAVGPEFFDKYFYVADQLGQNAKAEDVLKIMEALGARAILKRTEDTDTKIGF